MQRTTKRHGASLLLSLAKDLYVCVCWYICQEIFILYTLLNAHILKHLASVLCSGLPADATWAAPSINQRHPPLRLPRSVRSIFFTLLAARVNPQLDNLQM